MLNYINEIFKNCYKKAYQAAADDIQELITNPPNNPLTIWLKRPLTLQEMAETSLLYKHSHLQTCIKTPPFGLPITVFRYKMI
jgi:hypothetical protein